MVTLPIKIRSGKFIWWKEGNCANRFRWSLFRLHTPRSALQRTQGATNNNQDVSVSLLVKMMFKKKDSILSQHRVPRQTWTFIRVFHRSAEHKRPCFCFRVLQTSNNQKEWLPDNNLMVPIPLDFSLIWWTATRDTSAAAREHHRRWVPVCLSGNGFHRASALPYRGMR